MFDTHLAMRAMNNMRPLVQSFLKSGCAKRDTIHVVLARREIDGGMTVLAEEHFGDTATWQKPYNEFAWSKAKISCYTGLPTAIVQYTCPQLLRPGDTVFAGSAISENIVCGVSGVDWYDDEKIAKWYVAECVALCHRTRINRVEAGSVFV